MMRRGFYPDFLAFWYAARAFLHGLDPYAVTPSGAPYFVDDRFFYPFPSVLAVVPFAPFALPVAGALFFATSSGLLAFALSRDGYARLTLFLSFPYVMAASLGQWAPLVMAAVLLPGLGFLAVCKPNIGVALALARPTRAAVLRRGCVPRRVPRVRCSLADEVDRKPADHARPSAAAIHDRGRRADRGAAPVASRGRSPRAGDGGGAAAPDVRRSVAAHARCAHARRRHGTRAPGPHWRVAVAQDTNARARIRARTRRSGCSRSRIPRPSYWCSDGLTRDR